MASYRIQYVDKYAHSCEHITHVAGIGTSEWVCTVAKVIADTRAGHTYYTQVGASTARVEIARSATGREYIRTESNGTTSDNLLNMPPIPIGWRTSKLVA